ncbi:MAG: methyltransferase domain-containing protein [Desulfuromonadales bacterium]|nr:methyltransferase domain-containing protein [Desulfuromonadales bacterium]
MKLLRLLLVAIFLLPSSWLPVPAVADEYPFPVAPEVPFVPTPEEVVAEMLQLAQVSADDHLYDLGSGDGRIVITAAQEKGATGIGIDINPVRIQESRQNAARAQVTDKVEFIQSDLFEVDLREATVVTLYLLPNVNLRLRPKLFRELAPGTRVVSHDFDMGQWEPEESRRLSGHSVYFWVIPANATGTWTAPGEEDLAFELSQEFQKAQGTVTVHGQRLAISEGSLQGDRLHLALAASPDGSPGPAVFEGRIEGDLLTGEIRSSSGATTAVRVQRDPATRQELDREG